jgi:hypothetical protein
VIRRFRFVVAVGLILAVALAVASMAKVSFANGSPSFSYRQQQTFQSTTRLFVTEKGFPWGEAVTPPASSSDSGRLQGLAVLYAQLINGNPIQSEIYRSVPRGDLLSGASVQDPVTGTLLPMVDVTGIAHSAAEATRVSQTGARLFQSYIAHQQVTTGTPASKRVLLQAVYTSKAKLVTGRKKTLAIAAFLLVMVATIGLVFILENLRPAVAAVEPALRERPAQAERNVA